MTWLVPKQRQVHHKSLPDSNWRMLLKGLRIFFYWKNELAPRYTFVKEERGGYWAGHGQTFERHGECRSWVHEQPEPR
jgi:hypothetical protein